MRNTKIVVFFFAITVLIAAPFSSAVAKSINIEIVTEIREPDNQAGVKSRHVIAVDYDAESVSATVETGTTDFGEVQLDSIRNEFKIDQKHFTGNTAAIGAVGSTASAVGILGSIDYDLTIRVNVDKRMAWVDGTHNEYPSYTILVDGKKVYDRRQSGNPVTGLIDAISTVQVSVDKKKF